MRIRKLTSKEAWKLMGFSDEDYNRAKKVCAETHLYHQAGNSMVVDVIYNVKTLAIKNISLVFFCFESRIWYC